MSKQKEKEDAQMVTLKALKRQTAISHNGAEYEVDKDGFVDVPVADAADICAHGFKIAEPEDMVPAEKGSKK